MEKRRIINYLKSLYFKPRSPASFTSPENLYHAAKENTRHKITRKDVYDWLETQPTYTLHRAVKRRFRRNRVIVGRKDEQWQIDIADTQKIQKQNAGYRYILVAIDVLSKYAWVVPLKAKSGPCVTKGFLNILKQGRQPEKLQSDHGTEFLNKQFQNMLKENNIHFFTTQNPETKANLAERFILTLKHKLYKYFTYAKTYKYTDVLQDLVDSYNNTYHSSIKTKPVLVTQENENHIWHVLYDRDLIDGTIKFKFHVGDKVRLSKVKGTFEKGYTTNFTSELFTISKRIGRTPPVYKVKDVDNNEIEGTMYANEMQLVKE